MTSTRFLFILLLLFTVACSSSAGLPAEGAGVSSVQIIRMDGESVVGTPRIVFGLFDGANPIRDAKSVMLKVEAVGEEGKEPVWQGTAVNYSDYEVPYWVAYPSLPTPGFWGVTAEVEMENGRFVTAQFIIEAKTESDAVTVGTMAPLSHNRTLATEPDLSNLSSGNNPDPAFYQLTVAEAVASGKPSVVGFITPGLCESKWCAPVLQSVSDVREEVGEGINFIHIEVYQDFQTLTYVPEMAEWGLTTEPVIFILDSEGRVAARLGGPVSPRELIQALMNVLP